MRSLMFVPAHNEKLLMSAAKRQTDVLLLDLEDSVQPTSNKKVARENIVAKVKSGSFPGKLLYPRINDRESGELLKDLQTLSIDGIDGFMYPKARDGQDIYFIDKLLETIEYEKGLTPGKFKLIPLIETTAAVLNAKEIAAASTRVVAIAYGCEDFITDLGGIHDKEGKSLFVPRSLIAMAAKSAGVIPIDTVHINVHDLEDLEENLKLARNLGFEGMLVLNPVELDLVHKYFTPSKKDVEDAKELLELANQAEQDNKGVAVINGKFIGPPMIATAKKILKKVELIESLNQ